ncbi:MAG: DUF3419 family protein [Bacilli bacterium]|jgi:S-adenosylmethionine:diacylglycerol 3-amino-3-carboxypropyl transferase|nr:DUF3419 family protein [Bacilli bacterium]
MDYHVKEVDRILNIYGSLSNFFGAYSKVYRFTTENIRQFFEHFSALDKDVLCVCGSGDQMLNAFYYGAKSVTLFDINPLSFYQANLKKAAVCALTYEEFLAFFFSQYESVMSFELFQRISEKLDSETKSFFHYLYSRYSKDILIQKLYFDFQPTILKMQEMNGYLEKTAYERLQNSLEAKEVRFLLGDVKHLAKQLKQSYDLILLSNISDCIEEMFLEHPLESFRELIDDLASFLKMNGVMEVGYLYDYLCIKSPKLFYQKESRERVFPAEKFPLLSVPSYYFYSNQDAIVTLKRERRR